MSLKRISADAEKQICAAVHLNSFRHAIEELIYNSFDAESTSIAIRIFVQESSIQVIDNGIGISYNNFKLLGHKYTTSKFKNTSQDRPFHTYGYKGLSLASLIDIAENVKITSRSAESDNTFTKTFVEGKEQNIIKTSTRPSKGTTIEIKGFLYNLHIQKKTIDPITEVTLVKLFLAQASLAHLNTSISLRDDSKNDIIFQVNKNRDIHQTLSSLFEISMNEVQELQVEKNEYKIHGFIEKYNENGKKYSFVYVNGRFITKSIVHDNINKILKKNLNTNIITKAKKDNFKYEKLSNKNIPYYFVFIKCPYNDYDINHTSQNTFVEFRNKEKINRLVKKFVDFYTGDVKLKTIEKYKKKEIGLNNIDTRKQVEIIMQKFLGSNLKRKGSQIRIGVKGKNIKRKQISKKQNISISKIVPRKFNSKVDKLTNGNQFKDNNHTLALNSNNCNSKTDIYATKHMENIKTNIENINNEHNNQAQKTKNKEDIRISQDPLNIIFKNPSDTVRKRCKMLWEKVKHSINDKGFDSINNRNVFNKSHSNYDNKKTTDSNQISYLTKYTVQQKENIYKANKINSIHNEIQIKTSHDLIHSIVKGQDLLEFKSTSNRNIKKLLCTEDIFKTSRTHHVTLKHKLSYKSHNYKECHDFIKKNKFISNNSCDNFVTDKNLPKSYYKTKVKYNNKNVKKYSSRQKYNGERYNTAYFLNKNIYQSTLYTIESAESNNLSKEQNMTEISNYTSHGLVYQTYSSNIRESCYTDKFISTIDQANCTPYDFHKTYTVHAYSDQSYQVNEVKSFNDATDLKDLGNNANILFISGPNSNNISSTDIDPLNICETVYQSCNLYKNIEGQGSNILDKDKDDSLFKYDFNEHHLQNEGCAEQISHYFEEQNIPILNDDIEKSINTNHEINNENTTNRGKNDQEAELDNRTFSSENKIINFDLDEKNVENFQLDSRYTFVPKGMSQITKTKFSKTKNINLDEEYYEDIIYNNFAKNIEIYSEIFEPNVQNIKDVKTKELRSVTLKPEENNVDLIFISRSLKEATVLRQVDNKFIATKVNGKCTKTNKISEFLVLFDQHAVDERIRLENNLADYFNGQKWISVFIDALPVKMSKEFTMYLHNYKDKFTRFGLEWTFGENVFIKAIPKAIIGKNPRQIEVITKAVKCLIFEQIEAIKSLKGNVVLYPKSIMELVMSEACRYAIKFGDVLTNSECVSMLGALSECKLPFQCAHGRPVMAVMMELPAQKYNYKVNNDKIKKLKCCTR